MCFGTNRNVTAKGKNAKQEKQCGGLFNHMKNDYLEYYGKHHISPVKQDIKDLERHYERRRKLYRQCGIPVIAFRNAEILEVGPGGGYNTLAFFIGEVSM